MEQQDAGAVGVQVWSQDPVRLVLPAAQWAQVLAGRSGVDVPARFAVRNSDATPVPDTDLARSRVGAAHRMIDVVGAAAVRIHVGSWGAGRTTVAVVCVDGERAVTLASTGRRHGGGAAGARSWVEVSAVWGRDAAAEVVRAGHPGLDAGSSRPGPAAGTPGVSPAWAVAIRDGDPDVLRALLSAGPSEEAPDPLRALNGAASGGTTIRVEVRTTAGATTGWSGAWLATSEGTLALRADGAGQDPGPAAVRLWWTAPGEVSGELAAALTGR